MLPGGRLNLVCFRVTRMKKMSSRAKIDETSERICSESDMENGRLFSLYNLLAVLSNNEMK